MNADNAKGCDPAVQVALPESPLLCRAPALSLVSVPAALESGAPPRPAHSCRGLLPGQAETKTGWHALVAVWMSVALGTPASPPAPAPVPSEPTRRPPRLRLQPTASIPAPA